MELTEIPEHLIILGGGYIGLEFGQMFKRFGSKVSIIEAGNQLLSREDEDVADEVKKILKEDGINIFFNSKIKELQNSSGKIKTILSSDKAGKELTGSHILIAAGQKPNTENLNLISAGIITDEKGYIKVNEKLETNVDGIFALGDVKGGPAFTHISYDDYRILRDNLLKKKNRTINNRFLPYVVFIDPQLGRVGLNEKQAKGKGINYIVAKMPMENIARAYEVSETRGMMKILIDPQSEKILGCSILGIEGGEIMAMIQIAMIGNIRYPALQNTIFAHPTLAESLNNIFNTIE